MRKICLINPPRSRQIRADYSDIVEKDTGIYPPLGLLYLSAACRKNGDDVLLIDCPAEGAGCAEAAKIAGGYLPDFIGVTCMTFGLLDAVELFKELKAALPGIPIIAGGPHAAVYPRELLSLPGVDVVVRGEGEEVFSQIIDRLVNGRALDGIPGVGYKAADGMHLSGDIASIRDLNSLEFPDPAADPGKYFSLMSRENKSTIMMTSRGCPYQCIYCDRPAMGKKYRARSAENIIAEIKAHLSRGINEFMFFDDTFTLERERVVRLCRLIGEEKLDIRWSCRARVDTVDAELLSVMKNSGCSRISYGIESGDEEILRTLKKGITLEKAKKAVGWAKACGIEVLADFILGSPGETRVTAEETICLAVSLGVDYAQFTIMTLYPCTEIYAMALRRGLLKNDVWQEFAASPRDDFKPPIWPEGLSRQELEELLVRAYHKFYKRPGYIFNTLKKTSSFRQLARKVAAGWKVMMLSRLLK